MDPSKIGQKIGEFTVNTLSPYEFCDYVIALATWCNGMMGLSDGTLKLHGVTLPRGTQCEGYFQTRWLEHGDSSFLLVAWPTAFRLEALRRLTDWSSLAG